MRGDKEDLVILRGDKEDLMIEEVVCNGNRRYIFLGGGGEVREPL